MSVTTSVIVVTSSQLAKKSVPPMTTRLKPSTERGSVVSLSMGFRYWGETTGGRALLGKTTGGRAVGGAAPCTQQSCARKLWRARQTTLENYPGPPGRQVRPLVRRGRSQPPAPRLAAVPGPLHPLGRPIAAGCAADTASLMSTVSTSRNDQPGSWRRSGSGKNSPRARRARLPGRAGNCASVRRAVHADGRAWLSLPG